MKDLIMRRKRVQDFEENMWLCERTEELLRAIEKSREGIRIYSDKDFDAEERIDGISYKQDDIYKEGRTECYVLGKQGNLQLENCDSRIGIACFVSAFQPGGNAIRGGSGSEEFLCRQSTLFPCLNADDLRRICYERNSHSGEEETDAQYFYIPDVVCTRPDGCKDFLVKEYGSSFDVIGCARTGKGMQSDMKRMLAIAREQNIDILVFVLDDRDGTISLHLE